jgi:serine acetyltransferase
VITRDLPPYSVAAGAPARVLKSRLPTVSAAPIHAAAERVRRSRARRPRRQAR